MMELENQEQYGIEDLWVTEVPFNNVVVGKLNSEVPAELRPEIVASHRFKQFEGFLGASAMKNFPVSEL